MVYSQVLDKPVRFDLGSIIKQARLNKGLSVETMSRQTFIKPHLLEAIEKNHYAALPAPIYIMGYLRQLSKQLGLQGDELIAQYKKWISTHPIEEGIKKDIPLQEFLPVYSHQKGHIKISEIKKPQHTLSSGLKGNPMDKKANPAIGLEAQIVDTIEGPRKDALAIKHQAEQYADRVLGQLETDIQNTLSIIQNGRKHLQERINAQN